MSPSAAPDLERDPAFSCLLSSIQAQADHSGMLTFNLVMIRDRFFKNCGIILWDRASAQIDYNMAVIMRTIIQSDLKIGIKLACGVFHALDHDLTRWKTSNGEIIDCNLPSLFGRYMDDNDICDLQCDEEDIEDLLAL